MFKFTIKRSLNYLKGGFTISRFCDKSWSNRQNISTDNDLIRTIINSLQSKNKNFQTNPILLNLKDAIKEKTENSTNEWNLTKIDTEILKGMAEIGSNELDTKQEIKILLEIINDQINRILQKDIHSTLTSHTVNYDKIKVMEEIFQTVKQSQENLKKAKGEEKNDDDMEPLNELENILKEKMNASESENSVESVKKISAPSEFKKIRNFRDTYENFFSNKKNLLDSLYALKLDLTTYNEFSDVKFSSRSKPAFFVNIDTYRDKKDLKYENEEFIRINLPQTVSPPTLANDLMCVVQKPGIYPISSIKKISPNNNFDYYDNLPTPDMIEFANMDKYMKPSEDENIKKLMKQNNYKYASSTSGISSTLSHFFYKLTNFKSPHFYNLSENYAHEPLKFMMYQKKPSSIVLHRTAKDTYTINKNSYFDIQGEIILLKMGKYMEKIFTTSSEEFEQRYIKGKLSSKFEIESDEFFKFVAYDKILLRSQIDCAGKDSKGNDIVFEIKTRAVAPIRYDVLNYQDYVDYELTSLYGKHSSYEREFYDLIRGAFLKYLFQLKIGGMDGALISYHNTQKIFGFEYVTLTDMQRRIFGNSNFSDIIFKASLKLLEETLDYILSDFPEEERLIVGIFANEWKGTLDVFVELVKGDTYKNMQKYNVKEVIDFYNITQYKPVVHKYSIIATPILNNVITTFTPILYENNDSYSVKYQISYQGQPTFDEYMKFTHEAFASSSLNLENQYTGSWSLAYEK